MRSSEWMRGSDSKWIDNPQPSGHRHSDVKVAHLYIYFWEITGFIVGSMDN